MPICITGMHRSGTSMVARLLQLSGVYLGEEDELFAGRPDNPEGFFEHKRFYAVNDHILEVFKASWDQPIVLAEGWENDPRLTPVYEEARKLVEEFNATGKEWGWKDPRSSLTLAFWKQAIPGLKIVVCLRNPVDVCASLTKRGYASIRFGLALWDSYQQMIERETNCQNSIVTHYSSYFEDPETEVRRIDAFCGLSPTDATIVEACKTIDRKLRHSETSLFELIAAKAELSLVDRYVDACLAAGPVFAHIYDEERETMRGIQDRLDEAQGKVEYKERELQAKEASLLKELNRTIDEGRERMYSTIASKDATIAGIQNHAQATENALRRHIAELEEALRNSTQESAAASARLHAITSSPIFKIAKRVRGMLMGGGSPAPTLAPTPLNDAAPPAAIALPSVIPTSERPSYRFKALEELDRFAHSAAVAKQQVELSAQARLGNKLLPPGSAQEKLLHRMMRAKQVAKDHGAKVIIGRALGKPLPPRPATDAIPSPSEMLEITRNELLKVERATVIAEQYEQSVKVMLEKGHRHGPNYVPLNKDLTAPVDRAVKLIAFYLTQFHPIPQNDEWWGKGFTEWTNVSKAVPVFAGQYQPHLPDELGFYDLRLDEIQERQVELAKMYGLFGFAFYYYWFAGKRLLEKPLDRFLKNPNIDFPFCLIWANENWTRRWDGRMQDVLMAQDHSPQSDVRFIEDLRPYLEHKNYIRIEDRPLITVYRPDQLPDPKHTVERWREYCLKHDLGNPIIIGAQTFGFENPDTIGFDAAMQFPPHNENSAAQFQMDYRGGQVKLLEEKYAGCVCSYPALVGHKHNTDTRPDYPYFETAFPMWDNTPRLPLTGLSFAFSTPELYKIWLQKLCTRAIESQPKKENRLVFINAWNEWAEGAHLEPDRRFGYGYLKATRDALDYAKRVEEGSLTPANIPLPPDEEMEERLKDKPRNPILVYQIGKVGSRSIYETLDEMNLPDPVLHVHLLNNLDRISRNVCKRYPNPEGTLFYLRRGQMVRDWMERADATTRWNVITGVREPVSFNVSAFFEMLSYIVPNIEERYAADDITVEELQELFLHEFDHKSPGVWFDDQFKPVFNVDVYDKAFPHDKGYDTYEQGNSRVLLIRVEDLSRTLRPAMLEFLNMKDFPVEARNRSEDKVYHELAEKFKQRRLPEEYVERMHSTKFAQHFYTPEELDRAKRRWVR